MNVCASCGREYPADARFCMYCGYMLNGESTEIAPPGVREAAAPAAPTAQDGGMDWAAIAAAFLAFLSLRHLSRHARQITILFFFFMMFFGCPMICGFVVYVMDWFANLFH